MAVRVAGVLIVTFALATITDDDVGVGASVVARAQSCRGTKRLCQGMEKSAFTYCDKGHHHQQGHYYWQRLLNVEQWRDGELNQN